jgi:hypothetical protein
MRTFIYIILFCFFAQFGYSQDSTHNKPGEIGDSTLPAYVLAKHDSIIHIPDSAGTASLYGFANMELLIDDSGNIYKANILRIQLYNATRLVLRYTINSKTAPRNLPYYSSFFEGYCKHILKVERVGIPKKENILEVRFTVE